MELQYDRRVTSAGPSIVTFVRKLDEGHSTEGGGDATSMFRGRSVIEMAGQDQRRNVAAHGCRHRPVPGWRQPIVAFLVAIAPEWRARERVERLEGFPVSDT